MTWMISNPSKRYAVTIRRSEHHSFFLFKPFDILRNTFGFSIFLSLGNVKSRVSFGILNFVEVL